MCYFLNTKLTNITAARTSRAGVCLLARRTSADFGPPPLPMLPPSHWPKLVIILIIILGIIRCINQCHHHKYIIIFILIIMIIVIVCEGRHQPSGHRLPGAGSDAGPLKYNQSIRSYYKQFQ